MNNDLIGLIEYIANWWKELSWFLESCNNFCRLGSDTPFPFLVLARPSLLVCVVATPGVFMARLEAISRSKDREERDNVSSTAPINLSSSRS
jgi:hypothetical protein